MQMRTSLRAMLLGSAMLIASAAIYFAQIEPAVGPAVLGAAGAGERHVLYYRDPGGAPAWSAVPKTDTHGRAYLPVYDNDEPGFDPPPKQTAERADRKILYYRNPMGLPDVSQTPKKDSMGMDYIPVYEDEASSSGTVKIDLARVQRSGVRTEKAESRVLVQPVRAVGAITIDEARLTVVAMRSEGYVEDLFVNTTGQKVRAGEPLFRVYSADIQKAQTDYIVAIKAAGRNVAGFDTAQTVAGAELRLRNLGVPETRIREIRETGANARVLDWTSPATGTVISKRIVNGQRVAPGDELYRIADLSHVWVIADVAEADIGEIRPGTHATVTLRAFRSQAIEGVVTFVYPELRTETRTARVRIEVANPDERLRTDMYADVVFHIEGAGSATTVPIDAVVDSGSRQIVLVAKGDGQFEPRRVKVGRRDAQRVEILEGLAPGDEVVSAATFLIDAESNLQTALKAFRNAEPAK